MYINYHVFIWLRLQTHVIFPHHVVSMSEEYFDEPDKFIPERWLKNTDKLECPHKAIHRFVSLPFGYGRRSCLGRRFAETELQILLSKVKTGKQNIYSLKYSY